MSYGQVETAYAVDSDYIEVTQKNKKVKKPGFFKRWLLNSIKDAQHSENLERQIDESNRLLKPRRGIAIHEPTQLDSQPMHMKVYRANGGTIVEVTVYDRQKDRTQNQLHIITHDTDLGQGLAKIITMETLRG